MSNKQETAQANHEAFGEALRTMMKAYDTAVDCLEKLPRRERKLCRDALVVVLALMNGQEPEVKVEKAEAGNV
jgi:hypothetical protein